MTKPKTSQPEKDLTPAEFTRQMPDEEDGAGPGAPETLDHDARPAAGRPLPPAKPAAGAPPDGPDGD